MTDNVGLSTPRGSGTSGYVQRNLSHLKPRQKSGPYPKDFENLKHKQREPDKEILEHDRKREIEVKVFELRDRLEDEGVDEDEIDDQAAALREKLEAESKRRGGGTNARGLKSHQVHELAQAKKEEQEKLRKAFGISKDYEEGGHWRKQEERQKEILMAKAREEKDREDGDSEKR